MKTTLLLLLFVGTTTFLNAQLYSGKIGKFSIYLQVDPASENGEVYGRYFYNSACVDIPFEGKKTGTKLTFYAGSFFKEQDQKEKFSLVLKGSSLSGTWTYNGKSLKVVLKSISEKAIANPFKKNPFVKENTYFNGYEHLRSSLASFVALDSFTNLKNGIQLQWYKEKHWNSVLFRVTKGLPQATMTWVNNYMESEQLGDFCSRGMCGFGEESEYSSDLTDYFVNADFLSTNILTAYYCGGAHPDFSSRKTILDLKNLRELNTEDILQFNGVVDRKSDEDYNEAWFTYREESFAPTVMELLKTNYPDQFMAEGNEEECAYDDPSVWSISDVMITENGLMFSAYFYRAARSCDDPEWAVLSYSQLSEYLNPVYKNALLSIGKP
ncbi:MAG: hypothetical protein QE487_16925 [Fluviicola sp.]|nr:hypothetical protein [Fluviicola sp.]